VTLIAVVLGLLAVFLLIRLRAVKRSRVRLEQLAADRQSTILSQSDVAAKLRHSLHENAEAARRREQQLTDEVVELRRARALHSCERTGAFLSTGAAEAKRLREVLAVLAARSPDCTLQVHRDEMAQIDAGAVLSVRDSAEGHMLIRVLLPASLPPAPGMVSA
jgi:hypothetical protein